MLSLETKSVKNWSENVQFSPQQICKPKSIDEVVAIVKDANVAKKRIRMIGSGHSFTPLIATNDVLVSLDNMQGVISVDEEKQIAEVWAGTKLSRLGNELHELGYSQENLGDIDVQSVAGALLTGTHGTGLQHGVLATQIEEMTVVLANGEVKQISKDLDEEYYSAFAVSLGLLGIVVSMKLRVVPQRNFLYESKRIEMNELLTNLGSYLTNNEHFECFAFPYSTKMQVKTLNETERDSRSLAFKKWKVNTLENRAFSALSELSRKLPTLSPSISRFSANSVPSSTMIGPSYKLFATERSVMFSEMEYSIPIHSFQSALEAILQEIDRQKFSVHFPIECRFVKGDDLWLSPSYHRDSAFIAVHMYKGMPYEEYFEQAEQILQSYGGRPHWGKLHGMKHEQLLERYPMLPKFLEIREELDPNKIFVNTYTEQLFNLG
ncbi:D-arabinono-1,4-lactone oxidase [Bacillus solimangrovi]|uniref:FAD-binding oxidoreductase n=1 Tax=Bacillus solimangrovi TaxID=1305675 RepID=A0A1E5LDE1_9BACI|nr:D-arabinono-1,4-lactone oxidase [Bacillus solimangrovi]OEH92080.1 FAD-binding oxidoreductase [Bacillus solimangrovi]